MPRSPCYFGREMSSRYIRDWASVNSDRHDQPTGVHLTASVLAKVELCRTLMVKSESPLDLAAVSHATFIFLVSLFGNISENIHVELNLMTYFFCPCDDYLYFPAVFLESVNVVC